MNKWRWLTEIYNAIFHGNESKFISTETYAPAADVISHTGKSGNDKQGRREERQKLQGRRQEESPVLVRAPQMNIIIISKTTNDDDTRDDEKAGASTRFRNDKKSSEFEIDQHTEEGSTNIVPLAKKRA